MLTALKMEEGAIRQGMQVPLELDKTKNGFSSEPPEDAQSCEHI